MAAPAHMNITDITGRWRPNRHLSSTLEPTFSLQGIPWLVRKITNFVNLELQYVKSNVPSVQSGRSNTASVSGSVATRYAFTQTVRPGKFDCRNEYVMDGEQRENTVPIFGIVAVQVQHHHEQGG
ncbi:hypothetical protein E4U21_002606 [Claviceps maximensis]|nr:hypothetical protein E4U21_002606 [Claviceps maximensis]